MMVVILVVVSPLERTKVHKTSLFVLHTRVTELRESESWESGGGVVGGPLSPSPEAQREGYRHSRKGVQIKRAWSSTCTSGPLGSHSRMKFPYSCLPVTEEQHLFSATNTLFKISI